MNNNKKLLLRGLAFLLVLGFVIWGLQGIFGLDSSRSYENERGYLRESKGSLDAVYIGGSDVHAFWQPLFGWNDCGIAVWNYSIDSLPMAAVKNLIIEARKTQPQALFIISISTFKRNSVGGSMVDIHRIVDYQPFSLNKVRLINRLTEGTEYTGLDKLEFYFPIIRFHSRWNSLGNWVFGDQEMDYKASMHTSTFYNTVEDLTKTLQVYDEREQLPEDVENVVNELLDYCDSEKLNVLFIKAPQAASVAEQGRMNTIEDIVIDRGYPCLDLLEKIDDVGLELQTDFYNKFHTNVHGSLKYCRLLADYLTEHYDFTDKRGQAGWESWDESAAAYVNGLACVTLPFEFENRLRDYSLGIPILSEIKVEECTLSLSWSNSEGADGYEIYRLCPAEDNRWTKVTTVEADELSYLDTGLSAQTTYYYRVVPFCMSDGEQAYGSFFIKGVSEKTGGKS